MISSPPRVTGLQRSQSAQNPQSAAGALAAALTGVQKPSKDNNGGKNNDKRPLAQSGNVPKPAGGQYMALPPEVLSPRAEMISPRGQYYFFVEKFKKLIFEEQNQMFISNSICIPINSARSNHGARRQHTSRF